VVDRPADEDETEVAAQRVGALERAGWVLTDWGHATTQIAEVETRMVAVLDQLELTELVTSIPGLSAVGRQRFWPRPAIRPGSIALAPWSNTPGYAPATRAAARSSADHESLTTPSAFR